MKIIDLIVDRLKNMVRSLAVNESGFEIESKCDRHGNLYWKIYDLTTNKSYFFGSEQEVRAWIDDRYHRAY